MKNISYSHFWNKYVRRYISEDTSNKLFFGIDQLKQKNLKDLNIYGYTFLKGEKYYCLEVDEILILFKYLNSRNIEVHDILSKKLAEIFREQLK